MTEYIGSHISTMLESEPFKYWPVEKSVEDDLDEQIIQYVFNGNGLELRCDSDGIISSIFLLSEEYGGFDESLFEIPFSLNRQQVHEILGTPSKSGEKINDPLLGEYGAWEHFTQPDSTIHIEYKIDADKINNITLMQNDVVP